LGTNSYGMCEGDCDKDSDCQSGLTCFQRDGDELIPGCYGSAKKGSDYCVPQETAAFDFSVRLMGFPDPESEGETGAECVLNVNSTTGAALTERSGTAICQSYRCAGTSTSTYLGQYITLKSQGGKITTITEVEAMGVEIDCPYSAYSDDDGNFEIEVIDASGRPSRKTHVGVLPYKADIFDRTDVRIMVAKEDTDPEAFLVALNIDKSVYNSQYNTEKHRAVKAVDSSSRKLLTMDAGKLDLADLGAADKPLLDSSRNGGSGYGVCEGDYDKDSDCGIGLICFQRNGNEPVPGVREPRFRGGIIAWL